MVLFISIVIAAAIGAAVLCGAGARFAAKFVRDEADKPDRSSATIWFARWLRLIGWASVVYIAALATYTSIELFGNGVWLVTWDQFLVITDVAAVGGKLLACAAFVSWVVTHFLGRRNLADSASMILVGQVVAAVFVFTPFGMLGS